MNNSFFQDCTTIVDAATTSATRTRARARSARSTKTGYEIQYGRRRSRSATTTRAAARTDWLKTTAPIQPGETFTLSFIIFDEGDGIMDSAINLDNFRWNSTTLSSPVTAR